MVTTNGITPFPVSYPEPILNEQLLHIQLWAENLLFAQP